MLTPRAAQKSRPMSPLQTRPQYTVKRPPSAARVLDVAKRAPSPFEQRPHSANALAEAPQHAFRSTSSLSNRPGQLANNKGAENTTVSVRIRPAQILAPNRAWVYNGQEKYIRSSGTSSTATLDFSFDNVFTESDNNQVIYDRSVKRLVQGVIDGFHGTVFAYGMTGTGKTYSMQGDTLSPGIIPQAVCDIFEMIDRDLVNHYSLRMSYLEIYNEKIKDLLNTASDDSEEIKIRDDPKRGIHAFPLVEIPINTVQGFMEALQKGDIMRHSAATDFNAHSSRSHAVVQIILESTPVSMDPDVARIAYSARTSTLNLIDLAGSEKAAADVERRKEGSYINKSLLTLGTVIARLTSPASGSSLAHVPFRDSKLTRLLQHALSGLSLVSILATINADSRYTMETTNTLKFASRAKFIPGKAKKAELFGGDTSLLIASLRSEISGLRTQLQGYQALVSTMQNGGQVPLNSALALSAPLSDIHEDDLVTKALQQKIDDLSQAKIESDMYIQTLQTELARYQTVGLVQQVENARPSTTTQSSPSNFSYPSSLAQRVVSDPLTPKKIPEKPANEHDDQLDALADRQLAATALTKSQRSREQARDLSLQIAQLKKREDKKTFASRLGLHNLAKSHSGADEGKENTNDVLPRTSPRTHHTLVSPNIRAPREAGFF